MANTSIHHGTYASIPTDASRGLLFLKALLPVLDALDGKYNQLNQFMTSDATFTINDNSPIPVDQLRNGLEMRSRHLSTFYHELHTAWDIDLGDEKRTVMFESTSTTAFQSDAQGVPARVKEFGVLELETSSGGLRGTSMQTFMDSRAVENRAATLKGKS